jgi:hypothetical protein
MTPRRARTGWIAIGWATSAILSLASPAFPAQSGEKPPADPGQQMIAVLSAPGPHASLGDQARVWDRFVGTWDCDFGFYLEDGTVRHSPGELEFGWVLDGRAIQDLWITYPKEGEKERSIGTSIRFFDDASRTWRVLFVNPRYGAVLSVQGGMVGDRIVLGGQDPDGSQLRWSFDDIKDGSFTWRGERSRDGGKTWRLEEEHHMRRRPSGQAKEATLVFERLASLVGEWRGIQDGTEFRVTYTLIADGSALMEEFRPRNGPTMVTMFSLDGDRLLATHYCSAKNQPQMATEGIADPMAKSVAFSLLRVTGLTSPGAWHNTGLVVTMEDSDHLTQKWTYLYNGKAGTNLFHLTRDR